MAEENTRVGTDTDSEILETQQNAVPKNTKKATKYGLRVFQEWFAQQDDFRAEIQDMEKEELCSCLKKFYLCARSHDGGYYSKASLLSIRAAIDRFLRDDPNNKPFSIICSPEFTEANKALKSFLKSLISSGEIQPRVHKNPLTPEVVEQLYDAGELVESTSQDPSKLLQTAWFFVTLYTGRKGHVNQRNLTRNSLKLFKTSVTGKEYFELDVEKPRTVLATKNNQGGPESMDDPMDSKIFEWKGSPRCPVALLKAYLSHLNPTIEALFQKPRGNNVFIPSQQQVWYSKIPLGHNSIENMMKKMCLNAGINPPFTNHCLKVTTVNVLSARDMNSPCIKSVVEHGMDSSLESYPNCMAVEPLAMTELTNPGHCFALQVVNSSMSNTSNPIQGAFQPEFYVEAPQEMSTIFNTQEDISNACGFTNCTFS